MVRGIESFRTKFRGYESNYVIIGGTACDILMERDGAEFRATKDIDLVVIVEAADAAFGKVFWDYIREGEYEHRLNSSGKPQFYRFSHPKSKEYPAMIELFSGKSEAMVLPEDARLMPFSADEEISSLSAILLDPDYYAFLKSGCRTVDGLSVLDVPWLIPFKAKAWMDLREKKAEGIHVDSRDIRKHRNDVFRLTELLTGRERIAVTEPVWDDIQVFLNLLEEESVDLAQLGLLGRTKEDIIAELREIYQKADSGLNLSRM